MPARQVLFPDVAEGATTPERPPRGTPRCPGAPASRKPVRLFPRPEAAGCPAEGAASPEPRSPARIEWLLLVIDMYVALVYPDSWTDCFCLTTAFYCAFQGPAPSVVRRLAEFAGAWLLLHVLCMCGSLAMILLSDAVPS